MRMKKFVFILCLCFCLVFSSVCFSGPGDTMKASIDYTADQLVYTGKINLYQMFFVLDGINSVTVNLYDGTDATGKTLVPEFVLDPFDSLNQILSFDLPLQLVTGLYVDITTAGTVTYKVYYNLDKL